MKLLLPVKAMKPAVIAAIATCVISVAAAQSTPERGAVDPEVGFRQLSLGLTRESVVAMMGQPSAETESKTLAVKHTRLIWLGAGGRRFVAVLLADRLYRWKTCTANVTDC
jgi:hypothetical protein